VAVKEYVPDFEAGSTMSIRGKKESNMAFRTIRVANRSLEQFSLGKEH
jgi:hypothetical protein